MTTPRQNNVISARRELSSSVHRSRMNCFSFDPVPHSSTGSARIDDRNTAVSSLHMQVEMSGSMVVHWRNESLTMKHRYKQALMTVICPTNFRFPFRVSFSVVIVLTKKWKYVRIFRQKNNYIAFDSWKLCAKKHVHILNIRLLVRADNLVQ